MNKELIIVKQLPQIEEHLKDLSTDKNNKTDKSRLKQRI